MKELLDIEVEVPVWKVPESILEESDINIEPVILYNCSFMLEAIRISIKWFAYAGHFLIPKFQRRNAT